MSETEGPQPNNTSAKELTANATWQCELQTKEAPINVGTVQDMICRGDFVPKLKNESIKINFQDAKFAYALNILEVKNIDHQSLNLVVTSYKAGKFDNPIFVITDGETSVKVQDLTWTVESVLKGQEDKPTPSMGPFALQMPWWFWSSILTIIFVICLIIGLKLKRMWDRKKLIEELTNRSTALTPFNQFNKDFRSEIKDWQQKELTVTPKNEVVWRSDLLSGVEKYLREYLMRELLIPTLEWNDSEIISEIKARHPLVYKETSSDIKKTLREIQQAKKSKSSLTFTDCEQLVNMTRVLTEKVNEIKQRNKK